MLTILILVFIIIIIALITINKYNIKHKEIFNAILVIIFLEIYIFNINSIRLLFKEYNKKIYVKDTFLVNDLEFNEDDNTYLITGDDPYIEISDINNEIGTIKLNIELKGTEKIEYTVLYTDETSQNYRKLPSKVLANGVESSKYVTCYLSGKTSKIAILFENQSQEVSLKINDITINEDMPFRINIFRVISLLIITLLVIKIIKDRIFNSPFQEKNKKQKNIISLVVMAFIISQIFTNLTSSVENRSTIVYNKLFVNALISGQVSLLEEPSEELTELQNPYDATQRDSIDYLWDVAYYNDSYYIYFGILPALILYVPYKLITGQYLAIGAGVLIFTIINSIFLTKIICFLYKKWFKNVEFGYLILAIIGVLSGSLLFWVNRRPLMYELVLSAGVCFSSIGVYFMFKAQEKEEINYKSLNLGALNLALAVTCRPNQLLVSLIFLPMIIKLLIKNIKEKKNILKLVCAIGIPYIIIGILLMLYNYIRFDNILEFGTKYQLTVNDMKDLKYRILTVPVGIITQLFKLPKTTNTFPFYEYDYSTISFFGYYYVEAFVCGLFVLNPILFLIFLIRGLKNKINEKEAYNYTCIFIIVAFIICILNIIMAGSLQRYSMDYAWILNTASFLILFMMASNIKSISLKKYLLKFTIIIVLYMLIANFIVGAIVSESNFLENLFPNIYYAIRYTICFWE